MHRPSRVWGARFGYPRQQCHPQLRSENCETKPCAQRASSRFKVVRKPKWLGLQELRRNYETKPSLRAVESFRFKVQNGAEKLRNEPNLETSNPKLRTRVGKLPNEPKPSSVDFYTSPDGDDWGPPAFYETKPPSGRTRHQSGVLPNEPILPHRALSLTVRSPSPCALPSESRGSRTSNAMENCETNPSG